MKHFAAIGTDGTNHVVWGLGSTQEEALQEGTQEMNDCNCPTEEFIVAEITKEQDEQVRLGEVSCKDLGIKVY